MDQLRPHVLPIFQLLQELRQRFLFVPVPFLLQLLLYFRLVYLKENHIIVTMTIYEFGRKFASRKKNTYTVYRKNRIS